MSSMKLKMTLFLLTGMMTMTAAESVSFMGRTFELKSFNQKASAMWEFTSGGEAVTKWTTLLTLLDRPEAKTREELDRLAQGILDTYKAKGGQVLLARTMSSSAGPYNYLVVAFDQPAQKRFELNFVKLALGSKNAVVAVYGVRISDPKDYKAAAKAFLDQNSQTIGKALEVAKFPALDKLPRREF